MLIAGLLVLALFVLSPSAGTRSPDWTPKFANVSGTARTVDEAISLLGKVCSAKNNPFGFPCFSVGSFTSYPKSERSRLSPCTSPGGCTVNFLRNFCCDQPKHECYHSCYSSPLLQSWDSDRKQDEPQDPTDPETNDAVDELSLDAPPKSKKNKEAEAYLKTVEDINQDVLDHHAASVDADTVSLEHLHGLPYEHTTRYDKIDAFGHPSPVAGQEPLKVSASDPSQPSMRMLQEASQAQASSDKVSFSGSDDVKSAVTHKPEQDQPEHLNMADVNCAVAVDVFKGSDHELEELVIGGQVNVKQKPINDDMEIVQAPMVTAP
ncbi:hypothetical protein L596_000413 [Steinernema carpocapsae]|uniref:WAP domain-containing protein n=1 Tax=Steinernema carpocapsae TaxID=34508 RepID=A0A4U8UIA6_STECR|nr:hypothetical protein L596_000413 [Steinernema carpocapsae]